MKPFFITALIFIFALCILLTETHLFKDNTVHDDSHRVAKTHYGSGRLKTETNCEGKEWSGSGCFRKEYYESGALKVDLIYPVKRDKHYFKFLKYYESGVIWSDFSPKDPKGGNTLRVYYGSGAIKTEIYINSKGKTEGTSIQYYESGALKKELLYKDDIVLSGFKYNKVGIRVSLSEEEIKKHNH